MKFNDNLTTFIQKYMKNIMHRILAIYLCRFNSKNYTMIYILISIQWLQLINNTKPHFTSLIFANNWHIKTVKYYRNTPNEAMKWIIFITVYVIVLWLLLVIQLICPIMTNEFKSIYYIQFKSFYVR